MHRVWDTVIINSLAVLIILAIVAGFSMVSGYFKTTISTAERTCELIEVVHHFLDKAAEPALFAKSNDNNFPDLKMNFPRDYALSEPAFDESNFYFSHFRASLKNGIYDYYLPVKIKLLI